MAKEYWCIPCHKWHEGRFCDCGIPSGAGANSHLYTSALNNQLYKQAESAEAEKAFMAKVRSGHDPEPPKWAKQKAKQIVADL